MSDFHALQETVSQTGHFSDTLKAKIIAPMRSDARGKQDARPKREHHFDACRKRLRNFACSDPRTAGSDQRPPKIAFPVCIPLRKHSKNVQKTRFLTLQPGAPVREKYANIEQKPVFSFVFAKMIKNIVFSTKHQASRGEGRGEVTIRGPCGAPAEG